MFTESYSRSGRDDLSWPTYSYWTDSAIGAETTEFERVSGLLIAAHARFRALSAPGVLTRAENEDREANGAAIVAGAARPGPVAVDALTADLKAAGEDVGALTAAQETQGFAVLAAFEAHEDELVAAARASLATAAAGAVAAAEALGAALFELEAPTRELTYVQACVERDSRAARKNDPSNIDPGSSLVDAPSNLVTTDDWNRSTVTVGALVALVEAHAAERVASAAPTEPAPAEVEDVPVVEDVAVAVEHDGIVRELAPRPSSGADGKPTRPARRRPTVKVF